MVKLPKIDLKPIVEVLKSEGRTELNKAIAGKLGGLVVVKTWDETLKILETEIVPILSRGASVSELAGPVGRLGKCAAQLGAIALQILSFVPGPVGIVCSVINAIACLATQPFPLCVGGAMLELLGCIPGGKFAVKGAGKLAPLMERAVSKMIQNSPELAKVVRETEQISKGVKMFVNRVRTTVSAPPNAYAPKTPPVVGSRLDTGATFSMNFKSIETSKYSIKPTTTGIYPQTPSTNYMRYILSTKTGKMYPF